VVAFGTIILVNVTVASLVDFLLLLRCRHRQPGRAIGTRRRRNDKYKRADCFTRAVRDGSKLRVFLCVVGCDRELSCRTPSAWSGYIGGMLYWRMSGEGESGWGSNGLAALCATRYRATRTTYLSSTRHSQRTTTNDGRLWTSTKTKRASLAAAKFVQSYIFQQCGDESKMPRMPTIQDYISLARQQS
jgi:hypothetical protein